MKKLLTIVAIATLSLGLGAISMAQDAGPQGGKLEGKRPGMHRGGGIKLMEKIQKEVLATLTLSDVQKSKIESLNKDLVEKMKALRQENKGAGAGAASGAKAGPGPKAKEIRRDYENELRSVLGPDNWKKYREGMLEKMKEAREKMKGEHGGGKP
jgi:hypothetical protein